MNEELTKLFDYLSDCIEERRFADLRMALLDTEPADIAIFMEERLDDKKQLMFFRMLPKEKASDVFIEIDTDTQENLIKAFTDKELKDVIGAIKESLGDKVKEVRLTTKLKSYPVCLTAGGEVSIEMEKVFNSMPNADGKVKAEKILEISSSHKIVDTLKKVYNEDKEVLKQYATVLYEQARLLEGLAIDDVTGFVNAISDII